jgi:hypothetical protein
MFSLGCGVEGGVGDSVGIWLLERRSRSRFDMLLEQTVPSKIKEINYLE